MFIFVFIIYLVRFGRLGFRLRKFKVSLVLDGYERSRIVKMSILLFGFEFKFLGSLFF